MTRKNKLQKEQFLGAETNKFSTAIKQAMEELFKVSEDNGLDPRLVMLCAHDVLFTWSTNTRAAVEAMGCAYVLKSEEMTQMLADVEETAWKRAKQYF